MDDPDVIKPIRFLREREIVNYQRFGETEQSLWNDRSRMTDNPLAIKKTRRSSYIEMHICKFSEFF